MKLEQLKLLAVGPFTDLTLDFAVESPRVHLIYGPNEAGKSSALRAVVDLLYGFPTQTSDDFVHAYGKLRVGAVLRIDDQERLEVVRRKANKGSLRNATDEELVDEEVLQRRLGSVGRELFLTMFGLDHARLRKGGREMVEGGGKAGETLFAAAAGLSKLRSVQQSLWAANDELFKSSAKSSLIRKRIDDFNELRKQQTELQASAEQWTERNQRLCDLRVELKRLDDELLKLQSERNRLQRIQSAALPIGRRRQLLAPLDALKDVPRLPLEFSEQVSRLMMDWGQTKHSVEDRAKFVERLRAELDSLPGDSHWLLHAETIELLYQEFGSRRAAAADRPKLEASRAESERQIQAIAHRLGMADGVTALQSLHLSSDKKVRIQTLANQRDGFLQRLQACRRDAESIRREISAAELSLVALKIPANWEMLDAQLERYRVDADLEDECAQVKVELDEQEEALRLTTSRLKLFRGSAKELETLAIPGPATIDHYDELCRSAADKTVRLRERLQLNADELEDIAGRLETLERTQNIPTEADLLKARRLRDEGWELIVASRTDKPSKRSGRSEVTIESTNTDSPSTPADFLAAFPSATTLEDAYRLSVLESDRLSDELRLHAEQVATKAGLLFERSKKLALDAKLKHEVASSVESESHLHRQWKAQWSSCGIEPLSPKEMREWVANFQEIVDASSATDRMRRQLERLQQRVLHVSDELARTLEPFTSEARDVVGESLKSRLRLMEDLADRYREAAGQRSQIEADLAKDRLRLEAAESQLAEASEAWERWKTDWSSEMERLRLDEQSLPAQANVVLEEIDNVRREEEKLAGLKRRIEGIDRDAIEYEKRVREQASILMPELCNASVEVVIKTLSEKLRSARDHAERREVLSEKLHEAERLLQESQSRSLELERILRDAMRSAKCTDFDQLPTVAADSVKRSELENRLRELDEEILLHAQTQPMDDFIADVDKTSLDDLPFHLHRLDGETRERTLARDELLSRIADAKADLGRINGNAEVALLAEKGQSLAAEIGEHVQNLAVQRLATKVLTTAMERYREKNQDRCSAWQASIFA